MNPEHVFNVLLSPVVSEKSAHAADRANQYVFRVLPGSTKPEISHAVEKMFDVKVDSIQVMNVKGKSKRFGGRRGQRSDWRKAYVRLQAGQDIDFGGGA